MRIFAKLRDTPVARFYSLKMNTNYFTHGPGLRYKEAAIRGDRVVDFVQETITTYYMYRKQINKHIHVRSIRVFYKT